MFNSITGMCADGIPKFLGFIDFSIAPTLLYYAYIPILIFNTIFGIFIFRQNKSNILNKILFFISIFFSLWILNIFLQWIAIQNKIIYVAWELTAIFELPIFLLSIYLIENFIDQKDIHLRIKKIFLFILFLPVLLLLLTKFNINSYDYEQCQGVVGQLWIYIYGVELFSIIWVAVAGILYRKRNLIDPQYGRKIIILTLGIVLFLSFFSLSNIVGEILKIYQINLIGPIGMVVFLGLVAYLIVKYNTFNAKLFGAQVLIASLVLFIGSQFFFIKETVNYILTTITFIITVIFGYLLIKSVRKEIEQKEQLAQLNNELQSTIQQRESLVHLVTHKVKSSFTRTKYIFAGMLDGTFGEIPPEITKRAKQGLESDDMGIKTVDLVLNASNLQKGAVKYEMATTDLKSLIDKSVAEKRVEAESRGLKVESTIKDDAYNIFGDAFWLKEAINNLLENSIKYTKEGAIAIGLEKHEKKIIFSVKDTGIGITDEDKKNLFTEGGRGKDSVRVNVDSTGYGLYSVKLIIEAHNGKVWAESEGPGKGSVFFIELPTAQQAD